MDNKKNKLNKYIMSKNKQMQLSENLQWLLDDKNIKAAELSRRVGIKPSTLHGYSNGAIPQGIATIRKIADFFSITIDELLYREVQYDKAENIKSPIEGKYEIKLEVKRTEK